MRISSIIGKLANSGPGAVVVDESFKRLVLWTSPSFLRDKTVLKELRLYFPGLILGQRGLLIKLGSYSSLAIANKTLAEARKNASSSAIRQLFLLPAKRVQSPKPKPFVRQSKVKEVIV